MTLEQRKIRIDQNKVKYGLDISFIRSLKIPKLLSHSIGHHLTIRQIKDEKNNFSIVEKINQLNNLIKCMKKKQKIIERVESKKKNNKLQEIINTSQENINTEINPRKVSVIVLKRLDNISKRFEIVEPNI
jgi:hypothetical protein